MFSRWQMGRHLSLVEMLRLLCLSILLKHNKARDQIAQANTHTQSHLNNASSEMIISTPCLGLYYTFFPWFTQCI